LDSAGIGFGGLACPPVPQLGAVREFACGKRIGRETGISAREARLNRMKERIGRVSVLSRRRLNKFCHSLYKIAAYYNLKFKSPS
jgi:hypothetical protein